MPTNLTGRRGEAGFTLIELLIVMVIIGILAAISVPLYLRQRNSGWDAQARSDLRNLGSIEENYFTENGHYKVGVVNAATPTTIPGFNRSTNVTSVTVRGYPATGTSASVTAATATNATRGFCAIALSQSGASFVYDSLRGGLQSTATTCP